jgi:[ribosomal protein S18]-alanine N-acetyltransferase
MSAQLQPDEPGDLRCVPMTVADLDRVMAIERVAYEFPWTRGNFVDSLAAGYDALLLRDGWGAIRAYCVVMPGVQETHLLNLTVAPPYQGSGLARLMLDILVADSPAATRWMMLEVRLSNERAQAIYRRYGFVEVGRRPGYYPAAHGRREDACVMRLALERRTSSGEAG